MVTAPEITRVREDSLKVNKEVAWNLISKLSDEQILEEIQQNDPFIWIYKNVPTESGTRLEFDRRPYLKDIFQDFSPHIVYKKSAQVGITMAGIAKMLYAIDAVGIKAAIYTFPTAREVGDFNKGRFKFIIQNSRYLSSRIGDVANVGMIRMGKSTMYFKGASKDSQAISVPSDLNVHDELNFSDPSTREVYSSRLDASNFMYNGEEQEGWEWDFSTPTLPKYGVSALYDESDQHEWWVRCTRCRRRQRVDFFKNMRKTRSRGRFFGCRKCDKELNRTKGQWKARNPGAFIRGYHITQPMCAYVNAEKMYRLWTRKKKTPEGKRQFFNFNLGQDYEDGTESITKELVQSRVIQGTVEAGPIYMGVDQGSVLHVTVTKFVNGRRRYIWLDTINTFDELENILDHYNPRICVLDGMPNQHNARFLAKTRHNVYLMYYGGKKKLQKSHWEKDLEEKELSLPRTELLDKAASEWHSGDVTIENYLPPHLIDEFADQMSNMKRVYVEKNSQKEQEAEWVKVDDDHFRHADAYNWVALEIGNGSTSQKVKVGGTYKELQELENVFEESDFQVPLGVLSGY